MKTRGIFLCAALLAGVTQSVRAQSQSDFAGWTALMLTPVGAFPAIDVATGGTAAKRLPAWALRGTLWKFDGQSSQNVSMGGSYVAPVGTTASFTGTAGYYKPGGGNNGTLMLGGDLQNPFWHTVGTTSDPMTFNASWRGSLGLGHYTGTGGGTTMSLAGAVPFEMRYPLASKSVISGNITPGFGWGRVSGGGGPSQSGTRPMISFGGAWTSPTGTAVHLGVQKVIIDGNPPWVWGLAMSFVPGQ
jgi:hypothetical protein